MPPAAAATHSLSVSSFIRFGWETFKKRPWFLIGATALFFVIGQVASFVMGFVTGLFDGLTGAAVGGVVGFVAGFVVQSLISMGWIAFFIKAHDDVSTVTISNFWHPQNLLNYIGVTILYALIVLLGFVLLVVPGIIAAIIFMFAFYLVVDKGLGPIEALKESARITKGNRLRLLALVGALALVSLLGLLALVLGLLVAVPLTALAYVCAYRRFSTAADAAAPRVPLSGGEIALLVVGLILPVVMILGILSSVMLASLNDAMEKGRAARAESDMKMLQLGIELYREAYGAYPSTLSDVVQDPNIWTESNFLTDGFTYTPLGDLYQLCSKQPTASGQECVSPSDVGAPISAQ